jgi:hypothetical protein
MQGVRFAVAIASAGFRAMIPEASRRMRWRALAAAA